MKTIEIPDNYDLDIEKLEELGVIKKKNELPVTNDECIPFLAKDCYIINGAGSIINVYTELSDKNTISSRPLAEAFLALMQLVKFRDIWNDGWIADWSDGSPKYVIEINSNKTDIDYYHTLQIVLNFKSKEIRNKFLETFKDLIEIAKPLL